MMTEEEQKDWEDFIVRLDSEDACKKCFDSDTSHAIKLVAKELKERREDEEWLKDHHEILAVHMYGDDGFALDYGDGTSAEVAFPTLHAAILAARGGK